MTNDELRDLKHTAERALEPMRQWGQRCHEASVALVSSGAIRGLQVARGTCMAIGGQHSWVTMGDPYNIHTIILDPTLWSYTSVAPEVYVGNANKWRHRPKGSGDIFMWGRPPEVPERKAYRLKPPKRGWSPHALQFLMVLGPIDLDGWRMMANAPVQGWPATEIMTQMFADEKIKAFIPADIVGMVIGNECGGLYPRS